MRIAIVAVAVLAIGVLAAVPTAAQQFFQAPMDALQQVPAVVSSGSGLGCLTLNPNGTLSFEISYSGLGTAEIASHLHGPAPPGIVAGVQIGLPAFSPKCGTTIALSGGQQADLIAGLWYIQIHTLGFPTGEIRGQVLPTATPCIACPVVPVEESTWGLIKELYRAEG